MLEINNEINRMKKIMSSASDNMLEAEKRNQQLSQLTKRVSSIYCVDATDRQTFAPLQDRVVAELVRLQGAGLKKDVQ